MYNPKPNPKPIMPPLRPSAVETINLAVARINLNPVLQSGGNYRSRYLYRTHYYFIGCNCGRCLWSLVYVPDSILDPHTYPVELGARL